MAFLDETAKVLGIDDKIKSKVFCYFSPLHGITVEGYKKIFELSKEKVVLLCQPYSKLEIIGQELKIKEIATSEISIKGRIETINYLENWGVNGQLQNQIQRYCYRS